MAKRTFYADNVEITEQPKSIYTDWVLEIEYLPLEINPNIEPIPYEEVDTLRKTIGKKDPELMKKCEEIFTEEAKKILEPK